MSESNFLHKYFNSFKFQSPTNHPIRIRSIIKSTQRNLHSNYISNRNIYCKTIGDLHSTKIGKGFDLSFIIKLKTVIVNMIVYTQARSCKILQRVLSGHKYQTPLFVLVE